MLVRVPTKTNSHPSIFFDSAAARALMSVDEMSAEEVAQKAMDVAADMCVYTNKEFLSYTLNDVGEASEEEEEES